MPGSTSMVDKGCLCLDTILKESRYEEAKKEIETLVEGTGDHIKVDLREFYSLSSRQVMILLYLAERAKQQGKQLTIENIQQNVYDGSLTETRAIRGFEKMGAQLVPINPYRG